MTTTTIDLSNYRDAMTAEAVAWQTFEVTKLRCLGVEAQRGMDIRRKAVESGSKITESQHADWVTLDAEVVAARLAVVDAELAYRLARADVALAEAGISLHKAECYRQAGRVG